MASNGVKKSYRCDVSGLLKAVAAMLEMSGETGLVRTPSAAAVTVTLSPSASEDSDDDRLSMEIFRACADPGRKKSLRSLEIPLDNLLSGIIFTAGGRDLRGGPVLVLTQPIDVDLEVLMEIRHQDFFDMLAYFTSVPSAESRQLGFSVILDGEVMHDFLLRLMIRALAIMHTEEQLVHKVLFVSGVRDISQIDWRTEYCSKDDVIDLPFHQVGTRFGLQEYVDPSQLTSDFGGSLSYNHQEWVRFRMQVEPFLCDCISISKRLALIIEPFMADSQPNSLQQVEDSLHQHHLMRRKTLESLHIDELATEGSRIDKHMTRTASEDLCNNPDFSHTLSTISNLLVQINSVKGRLETLWAARHDSLQANFRERKFESEANKVIEWFEEYAEEFFQTHTELGDSHRVAETLASEVLQFEDSTKEILSSAAVILSSGSELEESPYSQSGSVKPLMGKIQHLLSDFDSRLSDRKKTLADSVKLHRLIEVALDWCIHSATLLSTTDMLGSTQHTSQHNDTSDQQQQQVKLEMEQFLASYPPPSEEEIEQLRQLMENMEDSQWIKDNATFAYHRVLDVKEKFARCTKLLDQQQLERQDKQLLADEETDQQRGEGSNGVDEVDGEPVGKNKTISTWDSEEDLLGGGGVTLRHQKVMDGPISSLHYDDTGTGHAMKLLLSVAQNAEAKLRPLPRQDKEDSTNQGGPVSDDLTDHEVPVSNDGRRDVGSPYQITKRDISNPTKTTGPLFNMDSSPLDSDEEDNLRGISAVDQRKKIAEKPCPLEDSLHSQAKLAKHRRKLMEELIQTEESYIRDMEWVVENYMPAMDDLSALPRSLVGKKNLIFSTLPHLLHFNKIVIFPQLSCLSKCPVKLGLLFMTLEEDLLNYSLYFKNLPQQAKLMDEGGLQFFADISLRLEDRFLLNSYLIKPFQRITKYKIFLEEMIKHTNKADLNGKLKEYYDKLKEAQKMVDFILRHGNDLLAVECLKGYEGSMKENGRILRQGDLVLVSYTKHHRRVFLFENTIILAKKSKNKSQVHDVVTSERFYFKQAFKTSDYGLRETVDGHPTRFELYKKKEVLTFQAETAEEKAIWVQDIWDLFFAHMLLLKDQNLEAHGSFALTSIAASGAVNIGHSLGHSLRRAMSVRHSTGSLPRRSPHRGSGKRKDNNRPSSLLSLNSTQRHSNSNLSVEPTSSRLSGTFVDLRPANYDPDSDTSSVVSNSSISTIGSCNAVAVDKAPQLPPQLLQHHLSSSLIAPEVPTSPRPLPRRVPSPLVYPNHFSISPPLTHLSSTSPSSSSSGLDSSHEA